MYVVLVVYIVHMVDVAISVAIRATDANPRALSVVLRAGSNGIALWPLVFYVFYSFFSYIHIYIYMYIYIYVWLFPIGLYGGLVLVLVRPGAHET